MKIDKKNRKRKKLTALAVGVILVYILLICPGIRFRRQKSSVIEVSKDAAERNTEEKPEDKKEETLAHKFQDVINQAERLFLSYDYDGALDLIQGIEGFEDDRELKGKADFYQKEKESCEPVNIQEVTHVFYHSLVVDPERAFANQERDPQAVGNNQTCCRQVGINVRKIKIIAFIICSLVCGFAGIMAASKTSNVMSTLGSGIMMDAMASAMLGATFLRPGRYNIQGTVVAALLTAIISNGITFCGYPDYIQNIVNGIILLIAVGYIAMTRKEGLPSVKMG